MEKKYKADNGLGNFFWGIALLSLIGFFAYKLRDGNAVWVDIFYIVFGIIFMLSTTIKEYAITELNFLEIRVVLNLFNKNRRQRIAIGDIIGLQKLKKNSLRIDKVRGFEVLRVKEADMDALISELKERNPRIRVAEEEE